MKGLRICTQTRGVQFLSAAHRRAQYVAERKCVHPEALVVRCPRLRVDRLVINQVKRIFDIAPVRPDEDGGDCKRFLVGTGSA